MVFIAIVFRITAVIIMTSIPSDRFTWKERIFTAIAWLPKATVQAAQASVVLLAATKAGNDEMFRYGVIIQTTAIISIVLGAPSGSISVPTFGPMLLTHKDALKANEGKLNEQLMEMKSIETPIK